MLCFSSIVANPPLGQITCIPPDQSEVTLHAYIRIKTSVSSHVETVILHHNGHANCSWGDTYLQPVTNATTVHEAHPEGCQSGERSYHFQATLQRPNTRTASLRFTLNYRLSGQKDLIWANEAMQTCDGSIQFQPQNVSGQLSDYLGAIDPAIYVEQTPSQSPGANLWSLRFSVDPACNKDRSLEEKVIGIPADVLKYFALIRASSAWLAPANGNWPADVVGEAVSYAFLRNDGLHVVILAISGAENISTELSTDKSGKLIAVAKNDGDQSAHARVLVSVADSFDTANASVMYQARVLTSPGALTATQLRSDGTLHQSSSWDQKMIDGLTYCTWNGLGQDLSESKILNALTDLGDSKIPITNLIIDDNWQSLDSDLGWTDFEANKAGFPHGLKHTISNIRTAHPTIHHVAVWHAILGYWHGIGPKGSIASKYQTCSVKLTNGTAIVVVDACDIGRLYCDFYRFLSACGVDSVKTDAQCMLDDIADAPDRVRLIEAYQQAWTTAALQHFNDRIISCMSLFPQNLFHNLLPTNKPPCALRNSDDFFPKEPDSHCWHVFANAHNALFTAYLNAVPDWDMFQTSHEYAAFHAAARCISGGPICITDIPGQHDEKLIHQLVAPNVRDQSVVLRPRIAGRTMNPFTSFHERQLLHVGSFVGGQGGASLLALFNTSSFDLVELVDLRDFPGIEKGHSYIVRAHTTGHTHKLSPAGPQIPAPSPIPVRVAVKKYEILTAFQLHPHLSPHQSHMSPDQDETIPFQFAVLGLLHQMSGAAAVQSSQYDYDLQGRVRLHVHLKALGRLGIFVSNLRFRNRDDDFIITIHDQVIPPDTVKLDMTNHVLEIDVLSAWRRMDLRAGWANVLDVVVIMRNCSP